MKINKHIEILTYRRFSYGINRTKTQNKEKYRKYNLLQCKPTDSCLTYGTAETNFACTAVDRHIMD